MDFRSTYKLPACVQTMDGKLVLGIPATPSYEGDNEAIIVKLFIRIDHR
jgi:hypothetical protein